MDQLIKSQPLATHRLIRSQGALPLGHSPQDEPDSCSGPAQAACSHVWFPGSQVPIPEWSHVPMREPLRTKIVRGSELGVPCRSVDEA